MGDALRALSCAAGGPVPLRRLPVVLSAEEVAAVLAQMAGEHQLRARRLYGTGLRISQKLGR